MTGLTLFSGGGGVELGLRHLVHFVGGVEYDAAIAAHAQAALGTPIACADVREVDYSQWAGIDYLHASPPCTNASVANAKAGETNMDRELAAAVCRAIAQTGCRFFSLENVAGYAGFDSFDTILRSLKALDFRVHWSVYDAADFGVPQHRRRIMLRAWRGSKPLPEVLPTHGSPKEAEESRLQPKLFGESLLPWVGWYDAIADLLPSCPDSRLAPWQVKRLEAQYGDDWVSAILKTNAALVDHCGRSGDAPIVIRQSGEPAPSQRANTTGGRLSKALLVHGIPTNHQGDIDAREGERDAPPLTASAEKHPMRAVLVRIHQSDWSGYVVGEDAPAMSATSHVGSKLRAVLVEGQSKGNRPPSLTSPCLPEQAKAGTGGGNLNRAILTEATYRVVALTPRCLARFQSFPDDYELPTSKSLATKIIGNAVPCGLACAVFGAGMLEVAK